MIIQATNQIGSMPAADVSPPDPVTPARDSTTPEQQSKPAPQQSAPQLSESQLADALKKVGIKAEIDFSKTGYTILRYVDPESQQVILQIPNKSVIALVANLSNVFHESDPAAAGAMIDQRA